MPRSPTAPIGLATKGTIQEVGKTISEKAGAYTRPTSFGAIGNPHDIRVYTQQKLPSYCVSFAELRTSNFVQRKKTRDKKEGHVAAVNHYLG